MSSFPCYPLRSFVQWILLFISISGYVVLVHGQTQGIITKDVDDTDASIEYSSSGWIPVSSPQAFDKTEHLSRQQGATANFTFVGIGVQVFGIIVPASFGGNTTISTYFLDDDQVGQSFTAPGNLTVTEFDTMFYQSPSNLTNGTHTLRIVNDNDDDWYIIDFLTVLSLPSNGSTSSAQSTSSTDPASSSTSPSGVVSTTRTSPSPMKSNNVTNTLAPVSLATRRTVSPGAAAGIALSSAIILAILVAILLFIYHRRRRKNTELARLTAIDPFIEGFLGATNNNNNNNNNTNNDGKRKFSPSGSPAAVETSAHGMFYPYMVEFFSRSKGPRSFKSLITRPSGARSTRSAKLNVSPMSVPPVPVVPPIPIPTLPTQQPRPRPPPPRPPSPPPPIVTRRSTRRNTKFSFLSNLSGGGGGGGRGREGDDNISPTSRTTADVQMGIAL